MRTLLNSFAFFLTLGTLACATSKGGLSHMQGDSHGEINVEWFAGSVDQAFKEAHARQVPIFIYWGAVWCPPCNEVKSQIFSQKAFPDLMRQVVPVYLDGDSEAAQLWGEKLQVSGYPTLLLLNKDGKEIVRIVESVNFSEFKEVFDSALAANEPLEDIMKRALGGRAKDADWHVLAFYNWDTSKNLRMTAAEQLNVRRKLIKLMPIELAEERSLLTARLLESAVEGSGAKADPSYKKASEEVRQLGNSYLDNILGNDPSIFAARAFLNYSGKDVINWLYPDREDPARTARIEQWLNAAKKIRFRGDLSADTRLWSFKPEIDFNQIQNPTQELPTSLVSDIKASIARDDQNAQTSFERHAFVSGAAEMLHMVGEKKAAKELLQRELKTTDTPWYYYSSLSSLAEKDGNVEEALQYSEQARRSAKGNATRLQWTTSDLLINTRIETKDQDQRIAAVLKDYYDSVFTLSDGFSGRNGSRAERVAKEMAKWSKNPKIKTVVGKYAKQCKGLSQESQELCKKHFALLVVH